LELTLLDRELGRFYGTLIQKFAGKSKIDLIASHGHTVFHQPENGMTLQIGSGAEIAAKTGIKTVCDFRSADIALGGQGAPLVPFGDELLFGEYDNCLNLGGYSNISFRKNKKRIAYDICPCNIILNLLANEKEKKYDDKGMMASKGKIDLGLLNSLNKLDFYQRKKNKSLGNEWLEKNVIPLIQKSKGRTEDKIATFTEHISFQISKHIEKGKSVLITGGGAYNNYLIERIQFHSGAKIFLPEKKLIEFKEALIFGLLGYMREQNLVNTF
jgi:anhydro-N-acetylmuramic acid kinase